MKVKKKKKMHFLDLKEMAEYNFKFLVKRRNFMTMSNEPVQPRGQRLWGNVYVGLRLLSKIFSKIYILH